MKKPVEPRPALTRRRLLGGALAGALAAVVLPATVPEKQPDRWKGKTRWIGHC